MATFTYFVDTVAGSDSNGGSSAGSAKAFGTGAVTNGTSTVALAADTPNLSTVAVGDTIRIASLTDGVRSSNIFEITAVNDTLDTVTVSPSPGAAVAQAWAIGGAFKTLQKANTSMRDTAGYQVNVKASASYKELLGGAGAANQLVKADAETPILWEGYTATPGDGGMVTIDGENTRARGVQPGVSGSFKHIFKNWRFTDHITTGFGTAGAGDFVFVNCRFDSNTTSGFEGGTTLTFFNCTFDSNGIGAVLKEGIHTFRSCWFDANTSKAIEGGLQSYLYVSDCLLTGNGIGIDFQGAGFSTTNWALDCQVTNCTFDGEDQTTATAIDLTGVTGGHSPLVLNNIIYDCVTGVIGPKDGSARPRFVLSRNNLMNANTTNYSGFSGGEGDQITAPMFTDEAGQDYAPAFGSAAIGNSTSIENCPNFPSTDTLGGTIGAIYPSAAGACPAADFPSEDDVRFGVDFNDGDSTGNLVLPIEDNVRLGTSYGTDGTEVTGTIVIPSAADVSNGVHFGADGTQYTGVGFSSTGLEEPEPFLEL